MARRIAWTVGTLALLCAVGAAFMAWSWRQLNTPLNLPEEGYVFEIPPGAAFNAVTRDLQATGIVEHDRLINWYARLTGATTRIQAGEYRLQPGLTGVSLLDQLSRGDVLLHQFTIVEGWRTEEMLTRLRRHPAVTAGSDTASDIMALLGEPDLHPEGQFLPDTYSFPRGTRDTEVLRWAHEALAAVLADAWANRSEVGVLSDPYDGLILASIVEKETALAAERPLIAGVFHRRLATGMRLQTDPTVIYGLGDSFDGNLTRRHLTTDTPYNTYTRGGLPPTPIALAGEASILAAFSPAETDALYFVATGDADGSHAFSTTLEEHNAAVRRYQRGRADN